MGSGASRSGDDGSHGGGEEREDHYGGQLYVSLKMEKYKPKGELVPHVYGSVPLVGSWDSSKAVNAIPSACTGLVSLFFVIIDWNFFCWLLKASYGA